MLFPRKDDSSARTVRRGADVGARSLSLADGEWQHVPTMAADGSDDNGASD